MADIIIDHEVLEILNRTKVTNEMALPLDEIEGIIRGQSENYRNHMLLIIGWGHTQTKHHWAHELFTFLDLAQQYTFKGGGKPDFEDIYNWLVYDAITPERFEFRLTNALSTGEAKMGESARYVNPYVAQVNFWSFTNEVVQFLANQSLTEAILESLIDKYFSDVETTYFSMPVLPKPMPYEQIKKKYQKQRNQY